MLINKFIMLQKITGAVRDLCGSSSVYDITNKNLSDNTTSYDVVLASCMLGCSVECILARSSRSFVCRLAESTISECEPGSPIPVG